jgi:hypothetical protein
MKSLFMCAAIVIASMGKASASDPCPDTTIVGLVPLTEMVGTYEGQSGGLYPGGSNETPTAHLEAGLDIVRGVVPRNAAGSPDQLGIVGVLLIGFSMTYQMHIALADSFELEPWRAPWVTLVNAAAPGKTADLIAEPSNPYWAQVQDSVETAGLDPRQIQVVLLQQTNSWPTEPFEEFTDSLRVRVERILAITRTIFPNAAVAHIWGREFAGYATTALNPEPWAYQTDFAMRTVIGDQIDGDPAMTYGPGGVVPWTDRGPYLWANGNDPREIDGLVWLCRDFSPDDGTHYTNSGWLKAASQVMEFIRTNPVAQAWFGGASTSVDADPDIAFVVDVNGADALQAVAWYDVRGRRMERAPRTPGIYVGFINSKAAKVIVR